MRELLNKSKLNKEAAELLNTKFKYAPSVHCSYYSFIQHATCILKNQFGKSIDEISKKKKIGFHTAIWNELIDELQKVGYTQVNEFSDNFTEAKELRVRSDYYNKAIKQGHAKHAIELTEKLMNHINILSL